MIDYTSLCSHSVIISICFHFLGVFGKFEFSRCSGGLLGDEGGGEISLCTRPCFFPTVINQSSLTDTHSAGMSRSYSLQGWWSPIFIVDKRLWISLKIIKKTFLITSGVLQRYLKLVLFFPLRLASCKWDSFTKIKPKKLTTLPPG